MAPNRGNQAWTTRVQQNHSQHPSCIYNKEEYSKILSRATWPMGRRRWSAIHWPSARHQPKLQDHEHGASVSHGAPVYSPAYAAVPTYTAWWQRHVCVQTTCPMSHSTAQRLASPVASPTPYPHAYRMKLKMFHSSLEWSTFILWHSHVFSAPPPVDPERCRSIADGHSAMQPHLASSPPAALASSAAARRVQSRRPGPPGIGWARYLSWRLLPRHQRPPLQTLRSADTRSLLCRRTRTNFGDRAFSAAGSCVFNYICRTAGLVTKPFHTVAEDVFICSVGPKCAVPSLTAF